MKTMISVALAAVLIAGPVALAQAANAETAAATTPAQAGMPLSRADRRFVEKASKAGITEVDAAQLALQQSKRHDVKSFAQHMIDDHSKANQQLQQIATSEGADAALAAPGSDAKALSKLRVKSGAVFDDDYIAGQRRAHKEAIALFSHEAKKGQDEALRTFAAQTLPTIQDHYKMITMLADGAATSAQ